MSEWKGTLSEACTLIVDCPHTTAKDEGEGYPLVRTPNIGKGYFIFDGMHRVSEEVYNSRIQRAIPQDDDLVFAREAPAGNIAIIKNGMKLCLGQRTVLIRPNKRISNPEYLMYYLLDSKQQTKLQQRANGATVAHINLPDIRNFEISLPSIITQQRIASILSSLDAKIENNNKINAKLEEIAQNLFKEWFVDFGPFKNGKFVESELGLIPEGWRVGTLGEIANINPSRTIKKGTSAKYLDMKNMPTSGPFLQNWKLRNSQEE